MSNKGKELQIELVELQIDHEYLTSYCIGMIAILFGLIIGFASVYYTMYINYTLYGKEEYLFVSYSLAIIIFVLLIGIIVTLWVYTERRKKLKQRIEELRRQVKALRFG